MAAPSAQAAGEGHWTDLNQDAIVLGLLLECADDFVSGIVLCDKLDVPRAELLKRIDSLRARGYEIHASGGGGDPLGGRAPALRGRGTVPLPAPAEPGRRGSFVPRESATNNPR